MNTLSIQQLSKTYPNGVQALNNISLQLSNGMFGLLGPNGAGKSTLMRTIAALQEPSNGSIYFNETNITENPQAIRSCLGYLPQEFGVYPKISAFQLLDHLAVLKGVLAKKERKAQIEVLLHQTNLYDVRKKAVSTFSGGMRQRFGIAQALLGKPKLMIVDEPTAGLDPEERNRFHNLLSELGEQMIVLLSTHIVEDVRDLCTNMAIMNKGQLCLQGEPSQLIKQLAGKVWKKTILKSELAHYQSNYEVISSKLFTGKTQIRVLADYQPEGGFEPSDATLEDVYFTALKQKQLINDLN
ncbi:MAG: ABC transporter ATP-binding protein [Flammeovirgaceae bacterium]